MEEAKGTTYMVAHDGSSMAKITYELILENFIGSNDKIVVAHAYDPKKTYLPKHMHNDYMYNVLSAQLETKLDAA